jgi:hypothetical protein
VLEAALARETSEWGWPAPVDDGDGKVDVYAFAQPDIEGAANADPGPRPTSGWLQMSAGESDLVIAHELLHVLQMALPGNPAAAFLTEGTAHWAGNRFAGDRGQLVSIPLWANANYLGTPLDCPATSPCHDNAGPATAGWAFFEYVAERFGPQAVEDMYQRGQAEDGTPAGDARAVAAALVARGADLGSVFTDYAIATASGTWKLAPLSMYYPRPAATLAAGQLTKSVTLDHLAQAAIYGKPPCQRCNRALRLTVSWPSGLTGVAPAWVRHDLGLVKRLKVSGNSATSVVPLDGTPTPAMLILANPSATLDGMRFDISATIVRGLPLVARILSASITRRGSARFLRLQTLMSSAGRLKIKLGKLRQMLFVGAGTSVGELFVPPTLHGRHTLKATPLDDRGRKGRTISLRVRLG